MHHRPDQAPDIAKLQPSAAAIWPVLRPFISGERRLGLFMAQWRWTAWLYELLRFGMKQGWACLFGGVAVALMIATWRYYPATATLPRYDFLLLCMIAVQVALLAGRLETLDEAKIILIYHVVGTVMELFKTSVGSWIYPEFEFFPHRRRAAIHRFHVFLHRQLSLPRLALVRFPIFDHPRRRA